jgi:hypothetical protein
MEHEYLNFNEITESRRHTVDESLHTISVAELKALTDELFPYAMERENLNVKEIVKSRRHSIDESLRTISVAELKALTNELFPYSEHPWLEKFLDVINDPASGTIHDAMADERIHVLYCHDKQIGMWFIRGIGKGPLQREELEIMQEIVERRLCPKA